MMLGEVDYEDLYYPEKEFVNRTSVNSSEIVSESESLLICLDSKAEKQIFWISRNFLVEFPHSKGESY